ncbi:aminodeoxychorismate synthase component I [Shimazuella sp. AN120528]|uniref:aminodeoxychorismate synthase component I n=1 Tax=Shimazuella soli TaxID=1892854 RepID=UPI001F116ABF|nr:aminodeoxychorismate synthase component I [Shimazuella soli]MCH5585156.1 aminodeoxychorismate synthase component I [Shimazuella soli]
MIAIDFKDFHLHTNQVEEILAAKKLDEVKPLLEKVESLWKKGFYAVGFVSYEAGPAFDPKLMVNKDNKLPLAWFAVFREPDHMTKNEFGDYQVGKWEPDCSRETYQQAIQTIHDAIARGDTYQVNHTIRMHAEFHGDAWGFYRHLASLQSGYNACLDTGDFQILSVSPELFFRWEQDQLITRPMKGTAKRGRYQQEDDLRARQLLASAKDRAENLMIVDLLRNDMGKIAVPGTVHVPDLFTVEQYPTLWTMTSTINAKTPPTTTLTDIFTALFPCGSITGAPKRKTMELITSLEQSPREVYCGTIGYLKPGAEAVFNVGIRTVFIDQRRNKATYGVGGGITWDSTSGGEYEEVITKAKILASKPYTHQLLESIRLENGTYPLLEKHLNRMNESANYFAYAFPEEEIRSQLALLSSKYPSGVYKVRLLVSSKGEIELQAEALKNIVQPVITTLAKTPISSENIFLYHKTTNRQMYEELKVAGYFDTLLWNERGELTEFTIGNLVLELDGKLVTPYRDAGLLAGVMRASLLEFGEVEERVLYREDLERASCIWLVNSVRGWIKVKLVYDKERL